MNWHSTIRLHDVLRLGVVLLLFSPALACGQESLRFNRDVLPILAENCFSCHGFDKATRQADLRLDQRPGAIAERDGQRAISPGDVDHSEAWRRIQSEDADIKMPPPQTGHQLTPEEKDLLRRWIEQGADYEPHWTYIPPQRTEPPEIPGVSQAIDGFIRKRLQHERISPASPADRSTLLRRVTLDLIGLPPTPYEIEDFLKDARPDAYSRVVDRLLSSEHFGERWARWWLDLAHYADSDGYLQDFIRPNAWRYRQWVVDAFNRDLPFDQFTIEQLAGDLIPAATTSQIIATGFLRNTLSNREGGAELEEYRVRQVVDRTVTVSTTWMALTVGCAECHDHKFDAITQRDFYRLYAFFNNADEVNIDAPLPGEAERRQMAQVEYDQRRAELLSPVTAELEALQKDWEKQLLDAESHPGEDHRWDRQLEVLGLIWGQGLGEGQLEGLNIVKTAWEKRTPSQRDRLTDYFLQRGEINDAAKFQELKLAELARKLDELAKTLPAVSRAPVMTASVVPRQTRLHMRGDFRRRGEEITAGLPALFSPAEHSEHTDRLQLARWLVSPSHPLTARVTVNRIWQELFGRGIVASSDNFGIRGDLPTHPELLDWLAVDFRENHWSMKQLIRRIVLSDTYQQSSHIRPELAERDPLNRLLARQSRLRLSGETVRDVALAASGLLHTRVGGPSVRPPQPESVSLEGFDNKWVASTGPDRYRRGLYTFIQRTSPFAQLVTFDLPDSSRSCTRRERSNTPLQALTLLNDPVFVETAQALAERIRAESGPNDIQRLNRAYLLTVGREPRQDELAPLQDFLQRQKARFSIHVVASKELLGAGHPESDRAERAAWVALASVLLNLDEFIVRE